VYSVTSYQQLRNDALDVERWNRMHPTERPRVPYVAQILGGKTPIIAASDYMKSLADQVSRWVPQPFIPLGTDGFGRSDTRASLRRHFEVDAESITVASLQGLQLNEQFGGADVAKAIADLGLSPDRTEPRGG
jgi:pyruvate dehydrogenase E1 component